MQPSIPGEIINLKDNDWLQRQKKAGAVVAFIHQKIAEMMSKKACLSTKDIETFATDYIIKNKCTPTFFQYNGFPGKICASTNYTIVHGVPNNNPLKEGDIVKIDIGATFEGTIADCAFTFIFGKTNNTEVKRMLVACQYAINKSIENIKPGKKLGIIGNTIFNISKDSGFGVLIDYGGHGIDYNRLHAPPFVANKSREDDGIIIQPGLSIAIEPMFVLNNNTNTKLLPDKWSVQTKELGCHYEHSVTLDEEGNKHIITNHGLEIEKMF